MASSTLPLSLLAKGIGQVVGNGHEKLEVYLEPEDYYNLKSYSPYHFAALQETGRPLDVRDAITKPVPLHKTFVTRKGALLIFSEELANKAFAEEERKLKLKHAERVFQKHEEDIEDAESEKATEDPLRTVHDLRLAILMYGNRPDYRKKGDDLYLRFIHEARAPKDERKIRPGFSPKRYITSWSRHWHEEMLQKLRTSGQIQDKTLYRQNPLLPHLYQPASYNLSTVPPPYRVTRNMLRAGDIGPYDYQRPQRAQVRGEIAYGGKDKPTPKSEVSHVRREPPPSMTNSQVLKTEKEPIPIGSIQAVRFLETGEVEEVKYSELKPQEKQEILAELLATAWEHGKHIEEMLDLVLASNKPRTHSAASSSAASELMMDMHRAILSLAESPVQRQIREKQQQLQQEKEKQKKKEEREQARKERKKQRRKKREGATKDVTTQEQELEIANKNAENEQQLRKLEKLKKQAELEREAELLEQQKHAEAEEKEMRRQARRDARKKKEEERATRKREKEENSKQQEELARRQQEAEEQHHLEEKRKREERREERRRQRAERKQQQQEEQERARQAAMEQTQMIAAQPAHVVQPQEGQNAPRRIKKQQVSPRAVDNDSTLVPVQPAANGVHTVPSIQWDEDNISQGSKGIAVEYVTAVAPSHGGGIIPESRQMPSVPQNTPATQQRTVRLQRQLPLENVIYEAKSKRSHASSSTTSSSKSRKRVNAYPAGTVVSSGDGEFATYTQPQKIVVQQQPKQPKPRKLSPLYQPQPLPAGSVKSHPSSISSKRNAMFPAELPGDATSSHGKSSFYGGAMPITSNIVKQTLSDKISILSASQDYSTSGKGGSEVNGQSTMVLQQDQYDVPVIGVEPPTPIQTTSAMAKQPARATVVPSPVPSASSGVQSTKLKIVPEKGSSTDFSNESDDEPYLSDQSSRSIPKSVRDDGAVLFTKKSSTTASGKSTSEAKYVFKGLKGPGSQSSAATLSKTGSKKSSSSITRGSVPHALQKHKEAAIFMPDQKILDVGTKAEPSSTTDKTTLEEEPTEDSVSAPTGPPKVSMKSSLKDVSLPDSSVKSEQRVSFQESREESSSEEEDAEEVEEEEEEESESEESEKNDAEWPQVTKDTRPISSRSAKLTVHAQKVAEIVVTTQRPESKLEEAATEAAKVWNKLAKSEEGSSSEAESEEETEEEDVEESSVGWNAGQVKEDEIMKQAEVKSEKEVKKKTEKTAQKEIIARKAATPPPAAASVKSYKSTTSTSVSSVQEAFVKEVKRKASELGIEEKELHFEAELVDKVVKSTVEPGEVEVFHDVEAGKHVVRSRHSSVTSKSYRTDTTNTTAPEDTKAKQKYIIEMPAQEAHSASPHRSVSTATSTTASPTSPSRFRALSQSSSVNSKTRKSSIPAGDKDVSLEYQVTSYEGKLGDPKPEEPTLVMRQKVEPEKLETAAKTNEKNAKGAKKAAKEDAQKAKGKEKKQKALDDLHGAMEKETTSSTRSGATTEKDEKMSGKAGRKGGKKGKDKDKTAAAAAGKKKAAEPAQAPASPVKARPKSPEVPFVAGRAKQDKAPKGLQPQETSTTPKPKKGKAKGAEGPPKPEPTTQVEMEEEVPTATGKVSEPKIASDKKSGKKQKEERKTSATELPKAVSPAKEEPARAKSETPDGGLEELSPIPAASPEDDYDFVRVEESPAPSEPEPPAVEPVVEPVPEDVKSQTSEQTAPTEATDDTEERLRVAEEEEARMAKKKDKEDRRLAAAEKRRLDVERKRKEKEEQLRKEKEEQERQDALKEELEKERRNRLEMAQRKKQEAENERQREKQEEELRKQREEQQRERERRQQEEHKRKMEEIQKKKRLEEERKAEASRIKAEEEELARKEEEELMAQMAEDERAEYERRKREEAEAKKIMEEERRRREEEEARIAMEQARLQAIIRAKQQAALEEKLKFVREFFIESNGMEQTQNVNRAFAFSYFELLQLLGLEFTAENAEL